MTEQQIDKAMGLLEVLATKLGVTADHLWGVLVKQAYVNATMTAIQEILIVLIGVALWKVHKFLSSEEGRDESRYSEHEGLAGLPMIISGMIFAILVVCGFFCLDQIATGFINPEYYALNKILSILN